MLDMLLAKTEGNLNEDEKKQLNNIVSTLKMNYIEELEKDKNDKSPPSKSAKEETATKKKKKK